MKYSIVMPVLLREDSHKPIVEDCIASIKTNSDDYELILVDDGSTLPTGFLKEQADVYIRHNGKNKGIAPSWNDGISVARGEYIVIVNDDITVPCAIEVHDYRDTWLDFMSRVFEKEDCGVVAPVMARPDIQPQLLEGGDWIINHSFYPGYCFMLKRDRFLEKFDEQFVPFNFEDVDYWTRIEQKGFKLYRAPVHIYHAEGDVLHKLAYSDTNEINHQRFIKKHGFDPIPIYYS